MKPQVSVVLSVYNKEHFIYNTIKSVLNQTFMDFEIIVINDGSTDNSENIIDAFNDKRIRHIRQANKGASEARNNGIRYAKSDFIALLDGDDTWNETYLENIFKAIKSFPQFHVYATAIAHKYKTKIVPVPYNFSLDKQTTIKDYFENSKKHSLLSSSSIVFHKSILNTTGYFDTTIKSGQDTDMWIRIGIHYPIVFISKVLVLYTYSHSSLSNTTFNLDAKPKYDKYYIEEAKNPKLKGFIDKNRYSLAILSRLQNNDKTYQFYISQLSNSNLSKKQQVLLRCPKWILEILLKLKALKGKKVYYRPLNSKKSE